MAFLETNRILAAENDAKILFFWGKMAVLQCQNVTF
jgi:hypothetical protein